MALTKRDADGLTYRPDGPRQQILWDKTLPGFGIRVYPSGNKSFVVAYRTAAGRPRIFTLGAFGVFTLQQARESARRVLLEAKTGTDPLERRHNTRRAQTVREFADLYIQRHAKARKKSWAEDVWRLNKYILPAFGQRKLKELTRSDIARFHQQIGERSHAEANRCLALLSVMLNLAGDWGFRDDAAPNPAGRIRKYKIQSRDRWVTPSEMPRLLAAVQEEPNLYIRAAVWLYLLTGVRKNELLSLQWKDVDFDRLELRLNDTKAGRSHVVPLSAPAAAILRELPRQQGNGYVLPGALPGRPLVNIDKSWRRVRARLWLAMNPDAAAELREAARADVQQRRKHAAKTDSAVETRMLELAEKQARDSLDLRLHDLRRTVGSWLATSGASLPLIGKVLNHSNASTTQVYARLGEDTVREAIEQHGARISAFLGSA